jgi:hypothetical protein
MWLLPMSLRARIAAVVLLGIFFIPFATSDLRGLSHVLSCSDALRATLLVDASDGGGQGPVLGSSDSVTRDEVGTGLCGGLEVDLQLQSTRGDRADVLVAITNTTEHRWQGTVELDFDGAPVPVAIGRIDEGETATDTVEVRVPDGRAYEITGTLLIGP